jgi:hypothetical protein
MKVKIIDFEQILPYWKILWPHITEITKASPILFGGSTNLNLMNKNPIFLGTFVEQKLVGVNSILETSKKTCRSRGLWVSPENRNCGIGSFLMKETQKIAIEMGYKIMWSMPRQSALSFYLLHNFKKIGDFFYKYEFGPHCFVFKRLNT